MDIETLVSALIVPGVTALATGLVVWMREVLARRDKAFCRREALVNATREVEFIQAYLAAQRELEPTSTRREEVDVRVRRDLAAAYALVEQARVGATLADRRRPSGREIVGSVFLWRRLRSPWARAGLVVHYYLLIGFLFPFLLLAPSWLSPSRTSSPDLSRAESITGGIAVTVTALGMVWAWRRFLMWLDRRLAADAPARRGHQPGAVTATDVAVEIFEAGRWGPARLTHWRAEAEAWVGQVRRPDGTTTGWVPAQRLRYPDLSTAEVD